MRETVVNYEKYIKLVWPDFQSEKKFDSTIIIIIHEVSTAV